jgi:ABC-type uncharacterized transport system substrate-binding protein
LGTYRQLGGLYGAVALLVAQPAFAHPHVWAAVRTEIVFGPNHQITGIRHAWTFDEMYTAMAVQGLDTNGDGVYTREELKPLADVNVKSLKEFDYFTFVHLDNSDDNLPLKEPVDYWLDYDKSVLTLHFTLPLAQPLDPKGKEVDVDVYDPTFFVAFDPGCGATIKQPDPDSEEDAKALSEAFFSQLGPNSNFGAQFAQTAVIKCTTK